MEGPCRVSFRDGRLASRRAEEAALRRFQAAAWLETMVGPLCLSPQPSELEFISCLRSGLILCNTINKIQPGAVPKVVANQQTGATWDSQPLPAYQYFENIRNFLVAVEDLKLPSFEASDIERENLEAGSTAKIVDCILALKSFHEWKQYTGGSGPWKYMKSPLVPQSSGRTQSHLASSGSSVNCRRLDMTTALEKQQSSQSVNQNSSEAMDSLLRVLSDCMFNSKENINQNILDLWRQGRLDPIELFNKIISEGLEEPQVNLCELKSVLQVLSTEGNTVSSESTQENECSNLHVEKVDCYHRHLIEAQETELVALKATLHRIRLDFLDMQSQLQNDFSKLGYQIQELSTAASGYHQAVKENRNLYNMLQELRGNIRVFCRIRPPLSLEVKCSIDHIGNDGSLMVLDQLKPQSTRKIFQFNKVFGPTATQDDVYKETQSLIRSVMDGYNVCIFAYGQTGSGKTHTMCGPSGGLEKEMGINYMALDDLFQISSTREDVKYEIRVQMVEIYNEQVRDLLTEDASSTRLEIRTCSNNSQLSLPDAKMQLVQSTDDVINLMKLGEKNRAFSSTAMNHRSSRSHSILTVHISGKDISGNTIRSCLHLVDLAGSERVDRSEATGDRLKEAQHINKSLSCLGDVITALALKNSHIPYRNSKLTQLLQNSLGGNAKMLMFAHVSPEADSYLETISTLKFAQRASTVELGAAHMNKESSEVRELKGQIDSLKKALASKEAEKSMSSYKLKENTPISERSKQMTERTPPRPRRLSIENASNTKFGTATKLDDRKVLKSPISKSKFVSDYMPICDTLSNIQGPNSKKKLYSTFSEDKALKENGIPHDPIFLQDIPDAKVKLNNAKIITVDTAAVHQCSPDAFKVDNQSVFPLQQKTPDKTMKMSDGRNDIGSTTKSEARNMNANVGSRGYQIRKSLQSIGKFINGSERRNAQFPAEAPSSKLRTSKVSDGKSPITADARAIRRQSLTNVQSLGLNVSRRSSLGGKVDSSPNDIKSAKTPPPVQPSAKATKRWL
ncbi:kinesin-like protein KIN-14A isoform X1 [Typha latifolia]|uniref:kinesin-like protein KIN-14A isoform X1 n=1 Tax=Typha latifolia TaxID=4733 RepID=UPI003C2BCC43